MALFTIRARASDLVSIHPIVEVDFTGMATCVLHALMNIIWRVKFLAFGDIEQLRVKQNGV